MTACQRQARNRVAIAIILLALAQLACDGTDPLGSYPQYDATSNTYRCPPGQYMSSLDDGKPHCRIIHE